MVPAMYGIALTSCVAVFQAGINRQSGDCLHADLAPREARSLGYVSVDCDPRSQCLAPPRL